MATLKQQYDARKLQRLQERVSKADQQVLTETRAARLILEAMDEEDLNKATQIIDKLRGMKGKGVGTLDTAIDKAVSELNKYTGGGPLTKAWAKLKSKVGIDNPLVKVMTFANALETGLKQIPQILKNNIGEIKPDMADKSIADALGEDEEKKKIVTQNILKALSPKGIFGAFKKVPYVDNMQVLAQDIMTAPLKAINTVVKQSAGGPQTDQVAPDMKDVAAGKGGAETKGTAQGVPAKGAEPSVGAQPGKGTTGAQGTTPAGETPPRGTDKGNGPPPTNKVEKAASAIKNNPDIAKGVDPLRLKAILDYLDDQDLLA
jgi:hypothetical protein